MNDFFLAVIATSALIVVVLLTLTLGEIKDIGRIVETTEQHRIGLNMIIDISRIDGTETEHFRIRGNRLLTDHNDDIGFFVEHGNVLHVCFEKPPTYASKYTFSELSELLEKAEAAISDKCHRIVCNGSIVVGHDTVGDVRFAICNRCELRSKNYDTSEEALNDWRKSVGNDRR